MRTFISEHYRTSLNQADLWHMELDAGDFSPHEYQAKRIMPHGEWFTDEEAAGVEAMIFCPGFYSGRTDKAPDARLQDLRAFTRLKFLSIPVHLLAHADLASLAGSLESLRVAPPRALSMPTADKPPSWPMAAARLPKLRVLELCCPPAAFVEFSVARYPALEWAFVELEGESSAQSLRVFKTIPTLQGLGISAVRSKKISLKPLPAGIRALRLQDVQTPQFAMEGLRAFQDLRYLEIADCRAPVDCTVLAELPHLEELSLEACDELHNVTSLIRMKQVKKLRLAGRARSYKDDLPRGFEDRLRCGIAEFVIE